MDIVLSVPLVGQRHGYDGRPLMQPNAKGRLVPHGGMACWYAAAMMVSYHYRPGPRNGLPAVWTADQGLTIASIDALSRAEGLKPVTRPPGNLSSAAIANLLQAHGPLWAAGHFLDGQPSAGHAIVIAGVQGPFVLYNDPWEPASKKRPAEWIAANLLPLPNALLAKDRMRS